MNGKKRLLVICGPTATGKTELGINISKKFNGEIVSADSRQVFRGMDIGTGKDVKEGEWKTEGGGKGYWEKEGIAIWMLDIVEPNEEFSVASYVKLAKDVTRDIWSRGKLAVIVGGTGFYIKGLIDGIGTLGISPNWELRQQLLGSSVSDLSNFLKKLDPEKWEKMNESDRQNPRRLTRAIEVAKANENGESKKEELKLEIDRLLMISLRVRNDILYERIDKRVEERIKGGVLKEIKALLKRGYSWENSALGVTLGYKEWKTFFEGRVSVDEIQERWKFAEHAYARRQLTWFKKDKRITWFDIAFPNFKEKIEKLVYKWYNLS